MFKLKKIIPLILILFGMFFLISYANDSKKMSQEQIFLEFESAYQNYGTDKYMIQEEITQTNHVLQAAYLANLAGAPEDVIIGLLLHDIGQVCHTDYIGNLQVLHSHHDDIGAAWAEEKGFSPFICDLLHYHTFAKITLCEVDPDYYQALSEASKISYHYQKEKFNRMEYAKNRRQFLSHPRKADLLSARKCDDMAKIVGFTPDSKTEAKLPGFKHYKEILFRALSQKGRKASNPRWREKIDQMHRLMVLERPSFEQKVKSNSL